MIDGISVKKIRVLHVVGAMNAAGLETLIMNLFRNIDKNLIEFHFAVHTTEESFYDKEIRSLGGKIFVLPKPNKNTRKYRQDFMKVLEDEGPYDVVHSHLLFFSGLVLSIAKKKNIPIRISHSHNISDSRQKNVLRVIYRYLMKQKINKNSTTMLGCSVEACEYVFGKNSVTDGKAKHFPNSIEITKYQNLKRDKNFLADELNFDPSDTVIGHIGRFTAQKNHEFLIELFEFYYITNNSAHLILVGEGADQDRIVDLVSKKGLQKNIHFLGVRKDIETVLSSIDLFLFPSLYEGLGIVLVEAQAAGIPCLVSNSIPQEADLEIGLFEKIDLSSTLSVWTNKMEEMLTLTSPCWKAREEALINKGYDIRASTEKLANIYFGGK